MFANSFTDLDRSKFYEDPMAAKEIIIQKTIQAIKTGNSNAYEVWKKSQKTEELPFGQSLRDDIAVTETQFNQALDFSGVTGKRKNFNVKQIKADLQKAAGVNSKAVILTKEEFVQRLIDQDKSDAIKTKEDVFKLYEEKELYIDSNNSGYFQPVPYSIGDGEDLFNLYIDMSEMSDDVKAYWRSFFKQRYRKPKSLPGLDMPNSNIDFKL